ncbi:alpha/beta hydrolase [Arthrobacter sp. Helios]|uniref:alpha/beta fold hydrolase n=1 Tax=Arthrobacter sp. Helios TaxID=2828862 RepID=UPI00204AD8EF|nr:alpha/beta hydrolase [Arthrobacter sp. Helios]UPO78176.1 alpha/beta hydrolase [Arthrobacter sp. Helios]
MPPPDGAGRDVPENGVPSGAAPPPAAVLDARLLQIDWSVPPEGSARLQLPAPSGMLAGLSMGEPGSPAVVLVPGVMGSKEDFSLVMPLLAAQGYYVVSYDLAGQYESAAAGPENLSPARTRYDYDLFVEDLLAVLQTLDAPAHVLGYSFAGVVAQLALLRQPELYRSLTLMSAPPEPGLSFRSVSVVGRFSPLASGRVSAGLVVWGVRRNFARVPAERMVFVHQRFALTRRKSVRDIMGLMRHVPDVRARIAGSTLPKLVAVGERDVWPNRIHAAFASAIGAQLTVYRGGHSPCENAPHQLARDLLALYAGAGGPPGQV